MMYPNKDEVEFVSFIYYAKISNNENIKKDEESKALTFWKKNLPENIKEMDQIWINKWVKEILNLRLIKIKIMLYIVLIRLI